MEDGSLTDRWKCSLDESIHQHAGGKTRIFSKGAAVSESKKDKHQLCQAGKFYFLSKYKEVFADPAVTKAKVVKRRWKGKKVRGVVVVSDTDAGILDHKSSSSGSVKTDKTKFTGTDALAVEDLSDAESDAKSEMTEEFSTIRTPSFRGQEIIFGWCLTVMMGPQRPLLEAA